GGSVSRLVNTCAPGATGDPLCGSLRLAAGVNQPSFAPGDTLSATVVFDNPGLPGTADVYVGVLLPDQSVVTFADARSPVSGRADDLATFAAVRMGASLALPFSTTIPRFIVHRWSGAEPRGQYTLFVLAVRAGAFADGQVTPDEIIGLASAPFSF